MIPFRWKFADPKKILYAKNHDGRMPWTVEIHLTNACNYDCRHCNWRQRRRLVRDELRENVVENLMAELVNMGVRGVCFSGGGEPLLWHNGYVYELIRDYGQSMQAALITNGSLLPTEFYSWMHGCSYVLISWHGYYRQTLLGIKRAVNGKDTYKADCKIGVKMVITPQNYHGLVDDWKAIKEFKPDYILFCPSKDYENVGGIELSAQQITEVRDMLITAGIDQDPDTHKDMFWDMPDRNTPTIICNSVRKGLHAYITADGEVYPCTCLAGEHEFSFGNINERRFAHIWLSEQRQKVVEKLCDSPCDRKNCRFKVYNRLLEIGGPMPSWQELRERHGGIL